MEEFSPEQKRASKIVIPITHNFTMFLIGVIVLGIIAFGSHTFLNLTQPKSFQIQNESNLVGVKTYSNNIYGFAIDIPADWIVEEHPEDSDKKILFLSPETKALVDQNDKNCEKSIQNCMMEGWWFADIVFNGYTPEKGTKSPIISKDGINFEVYKEDLGDGMYGPPIYLISDNSKSFLFIVPNDEYKNLLSTFKFTNNYDTFDPDGTLSDISVNPVFIKWLKSKNAGFEIIEKGHFSTQNMISNDGDNADYCKNADLNKKFVSLDKKKVVCFYSGEEPDSDLYLVENKTSVRIDFCGTPCMYETGFWLDNDKFVFLYSVYDSEYSKAPNPYVEYIVKMFNFSENKYYQWGSMRQYIN